MGVAAEQHNISVEKTGFKQWERKIVVSSGQVSNPNYRIVRHLAFDPRGFSGKLA